MLVCVNIYSSAYISSCASLKNKITIHKNDGVLSNDSLLDKDIKRLSIKLSIFASFMYFGHVACNIRSINN